jgi:hypothetical protein
MRRIRLPLIPALALLWLVGGGTAVQAQKDYYNLDKHRPLRVEDAYATERYAVEVQVSPLTLSGHGSALHYEPSVELKFGLLPGMEVSAGLHAEVLRGSDGTTAELGGLELSGLYNLNSETLRIPAFGVRLTGHVPAGGDGASAEAKAIMTRVLGGPWRAHVNGGAGLGGGAAERWFAGLAIDHVLPFRSLLLLAESYYAAPRAAGAYARIRTAAGLRYQLTPGTGVDAGFGRDWTGAGGADWEVTFGVTTAMGFRPLMRLR